MTIIVCSTRTALAICLICLLAACASPIGVTRWSLEDAYQQSYANALSADRPTSFTIQVLLRLNLYERFKHDPAGALATLHQGLAPHWNPDRLFALAEVSLLHARETESRPHFLAAAAYAYAYLVRDPRTSPPVPLDPRNRIAADLYNTALAMGLAVRPGRPEEVILTSGRYPLPFGELEIEAPPQVVWAGRRLERFIPAYQFDVYGLRNRYRQPGIGAPLIASLGPAEPAAEAGSAFVGPNAKVPVTAFLRLADVHAGLLSGRLHGTLEVYTKDARRTLQLAGFAVPLEFEPTSALAYQLKDAPVFDFEILGFFGLQPQLFRGKASHLLTLEPYQPGKIPVVLVHGTASSPVRWAELFNEMNVDPRITDRYQFWVFLYNSGNPIAFSGGLLRESLTKAIQTFDPEGKDPALRQMVVIGHSQGGLLAKLTAITSGTKFWDNISKRPLDELDVKPETREILRRSLFYTPLPFVKHLIFMSTPQRGSYVAGWGFSHWLADMVTLPGSLLSFGMDFAHALATDDPGAAARGKLPRSVNNMDPSNPFIKTLASITVDPGVKAHSIIAVENEGPLEEGKDGVVAYVSAHIEEAVSEKVVRSGHSVQGHPDAIEEVRRILLESAGAK
jgi:pimeloyl-ACP methyl ester carboxylesterase